ncbi:MAG: BACON domain-containing protein [Bacteroidales bacterium]|nr:BACON domain-containing protein [Bacteroidales bacterium]
MKTIRLLLIFLILIPCFMSCKKISGPKIVFETDYVHFTQEGGSQTVSLIEGHFSKMEIYQKTGVGNPEDEGDGETYLKMDWIEVTKIESKVEITTTPNTTGEPRSAHILVYELDRGAVIKVYQDR